MATNKGELGEKCHQLYLQSLENLKGNSPDLADEVIVGLWNALSAAFKDKKTLLSQVEELMKSNAEYYHRVDILESRIGILTKSKSLNGEGK